MGTTTQDHSVSLNIGIVACSGALAGMMMGGIYHVFLGVFFGITIAAAIHTSRIVRFSYVAATVVLLYAGQSLYAGLLLPDVKTAQVRTLCVDLPSGSTITRVERLLKQRHIPHTADSVKGNPPTEIVADLNARCLLSTLHYRTVFVFDKHGRLSHCNVG